MKAEALDEDQNFYTLDREVRYLLKVWIYHCCQRRYERAVSLDRKTVTLIGTDGSHLYIRMEA